jgi:FkbM family methyltransferase
MHAAVKQFKTTRILLREPKKHPAGFLLRGSSAMEEGSFEPHETEQISNLLGVCDVFVNVGANIGYYVCLARNSGVTSIAIEPLYRNVQLLKSNLALNDWMDVEVYPLGLSDRVSLERIYGGGTAASLIPGWAGSNISNYELIAVSTLDNLLSDRFESKQLLILIDVEGFEFNVLQGAVRQLSRTPSPIWFLEVCIDEHQPAGGGINPKLMATFDLLWQHGYTAVKAGCETGPVSREDVAGWANSSGLPKTHNFVFRHLAAATLPRGC